MLKKKQLIIIASFFVFALVLSAIVLRKNEKKAHQIKIQKEFEEQKMYDAREKSQKTEEGKSQQVLKNEVLVEDGSVYYFDENGAKTSIAHRVVDTEGQTKNFDYREAELSPDKKFILLGGIGWEHVVVEIYDIESGKKYDTGESDSHFGMWLADSRIRIEGECGMGISCGVFESINSNEPWKLKKIKE